MFDKVVEQAQSAVKPWSDVFAFNTEVMEKLAEKQAGFFSDLMNDGISYAKSLSEQKDITSFYDLQKSYFESMQSKMVSTAKDCFSLVTDAQEKTGEMIKVAYSDFMPMDVTPAPAPKAKAKAKPVPVKAAEKTAEK